MAILVLIIKRISSVHILQLVIIDGRQGITVLLVFLIGMIEVQTQKISLRPDFLHPFQAEVIIIIFSFSQRLLAVVVHPSLLVCFPDMGKRVLCVYLYRSIESGCTALALVITIAITSCSRKNDSGLFADFPIHVKTSARIPVLAYLLILGSRILVSGRQILFVVCSRLSPAAVVHIIEVSRHVQSFLHLFRHIEIDRVGDIIFIGSSKITVGRTEVYHKVISVLLEAHEPACQVTPFVRSISAFRVCQQCPAELPLGFQVEHIIFSIRFHAGYLFLLGRLIVHFQLADELYRQIFQHDILISTEKVFPVQEYLLNRITIVFHLSRFRVVRQARHAPHQSLQIRAFGRRISRHIINGGISLLLYWLNRCRHHHFRKKQRLILHPQRPQPERIDSLFKAPKQRSTPGK